MNIQESLNEMKSVFEKFKSEVDVITKMNSDADKKISLLYHEIEIGRFNASAGYKKLMELQGALRERRVIKHELVRINQLNSKIRIDNLMKNLVSAKSIISKRANEQSEYRDGWNISFDDLLKTKEEKDE